VENLRKKNQTETMEIKISLNQIKNTGESHSSRLQQVEDRHSRLEDKTEENLEENPEELLDKRLKSWKRNM
jgi:ppGpp synthetase/RelA/SpoT-type nucleotidyltranferase